jgi:hypothetical protein
MKNHLGAPTAVYRSFDKTDRLLYLGITGNIRLRWAGHAADKPWWPDVSRQTTTWYDTRAEAAAEANAISNENPSTTFRTPLHRERRAWRGRPTSAAMNDLLAAHRRERELAR